MAGYDAFSDSFHAHFTRDAQQRLFYGVDRDLGEIPDPSRAEMDAKVAEARDAGPLATTIGTPSIHGPVPSRRKRRRSR